MHIPFVPRHLFACRGLNLISVKFLRLGLDFRALQGYLPVHFVECSKVPFSLPKLIVSVI